MDIDEFLDGVSPQKNESDLDGKSSANNQSLNLRKEEPKQESPKSPQSLFAQNWQDQISNLSSNIYGDLSQKKYGTALESFVELKGLISKIVESNMKLHSTLHESIHKAQDELESTLSVMDYESNQLLRYIEQLLHLAKIEVDQNHIDVAAELYKKVQTFYHEIPIEFADKRSQVQDEVIKLYLYMKSKRDKLIKHKFENVVLEFEQLYPFAVSALEKEDLQQSMQIVSRLEALQKELPTGYPLLRTNLVSKTATMKNQLAYLQHVAQLYGHANINPGDVKVSLSENEDYVEFSKGLKPFEAISIDPPPLKYDEFEHNRDGLSSSNVQSIRHDGLTQSLQQSEQDDLDKISSLENKYDGDFSYEPGKLHSLIERAHALRSQISQMKQTISEHEQNG